jgi:hypothetical protein
MSARYILALDLSRCTVTGSMKKKDFHAGFQQVRIKPCLVEIQSFRNLGDHLSISVRETGSPVPNEQHLFAVENPIPGLSKIAPMGLGYILCQNSIGSLICA